MPYFIKNHFTENLCPTKYFNSILRKFLDNQYKCTNLNFDVPKRIVYLNLPYVGDQTAKLMSEVRSLLNRFYPQISGFYFKNIDTISRFFWKM